MARPKDDLSKVSLNQLETLTGMTFRSIKKYLAEARIDPVLSTDNCAFYDPKVALPVLFEAQGFRTKRAPVVDPDTPENELKQILDPNIQRARKDRAQADKAEFELEVLKKKYVLASEVENNLSNMLVNFRMKALRFSLTATPVLFQIDDRREFQRKLDEEMRHLLEELSAYDGNTNSTEDDFGNDDGDSESSDEEGGPTT